MYWIILSVPWHTPSGYTFKDIHFNVDHIRELRSLDSMDVDGYPDGFTPKTVIAGNQQWFVKESIDEIKERINAVLPVTRRLFNVVER